MLLHPYYYNKHTINLHTLTYAFYLNYYCDYINLISAIRKLDIRFT